MSDPTATSPTDPKQAARQSYAGQRLTKGEFEDAYAITGIVARDIRKTGSFYQARENYGFAFAKDKKISPDQGQKVIADVFKARFGQSMNQMREAHLAENAKVTPDQARPYAERMEALIKEGETLPFYQALDTAARHMARETGVTENHAKFLMSQTRKDQGQNLYDMGKQLEAAYHKPKQEAAQSQEKPVSVKATLQKPKMANKISH